MKNAVLLLTGCLNPPTKAHVRSLEIARAVLSKEFHILQCVLSPAHEAYPFKKIEANYHRIEMCRLAIAQSGLQDFSVDTFEALENSGFIPTYQVVEHVLSKYQALACNLTVFLVCGSDLLRQMCDPMIWKPYNVDKLLSLCGLFVLNRSEGRGGCLIEETSAMARGVSYICERLEQQRIRIVSESAGSESSSEFRDGCATVCCSDVVAYCYAHGLYGF